MKKPYSKDQHELIRTSRNVQRGNTAQQRKALVKALLAKEVKDRVNKTMEILYEEFGKDFNLIKEDGKNKYHITKKNVVLQLTWRPLVSIEGKAVLGEGQMIIEVNNKGESKIRLNSETGDVMYNAQNLSNDDLKAELSALRMFVEKGTAMPAISKFVVEKNISSYTNQDIEELLKGYEEDPEGSKPK